MRGAETRAARSDARSMKRRGAEARQRATEALPPYAAMLDAGARSAGARRGASVARDAAPCYIDIDYASDAMITAPLLPFYASDAIAFAASASAVFRRYFCRAARCFAAA